MAELRIKGKAVGPGTVMTISGVRGKFTFLYPTWSKDGRLSLTFVGGMPGHYSYRSFYPERVKRVLNNCD